MSALNEESQWIGAKVKTRQHAANRGSWVVRDTWSFDLTLTVGQEAKRNWRPLFRQHENEVASRPGEGETNNELPSTSNELTYTL